MPQAYTVRVTLEVVDMQGHLVDTSGEPYSDTGPRCAISSETYIGLCREVEQANNYLGHLHNNVMVLKALVEGTQR